LLLTTLKRYCIQISAARYFRELARLAKFAKYRAREKTGFTVLMYIFQGQEPFGHFL